jgi:hemolysin III
VKRHKSRPEAEARQSLPKEIASSVSHGIGAALSIAALALVVVFAAKRGDAWRVVGLSIYGSTLFLLYLASTLYHALPGPRARRIFRVLDHSAIFLLIAGTYTPVVLGPMRGPWGWTLFGLIWGMAVGGILCKVFLIDRLKWISTLFYVAMGWLVLIALKPMIETVPRELTFWLVLGGACYTLGVVFYAWRELRFHHTIWHLFVLAGSICHFFGLLFHVAPMD